MPVEAEQWGIRTNFTEQGLHAIGDVASHFNYASMVGSYHPDLGSKVEDQMIQAREFAGALLFRTKDEIRESEPFRRLNIPCLVVNRLLPETSLNYIGPDHRKVGLVAARHLLESGYRRIAIRELQERLPAVFPARRAAAAPRIFMIGTPNTATSTPRGATAGSPRRLSIFPCAMPPKITAGSGMDAFTHNVEAFLDRRVHSGTERDLRHCTAPARLWHPRERAASHTKLSKTPAIF